MDIQFNVKLEPSSKVTFDHKSSPKAQVDRISDLQNALGNVENQPVDSPFK